MTSKLMEIDRINLISFHKYYMILFITCLSHVKRIKGVIGVQERTCTCKMMQEYGKKFAKGNCKHVGRIQEEI